MKLKVVIGGALLLLAACGNVPTNITALSPTESASPAATASATAEQPATQSPTALPPTPSASPLPTAGVLALDAPAGLVFSNSAQGLWHVQSDGTAAELLTDGYHAVLSPDLSQVAYAAGPYEGDIWIKDLSNGVERQVTNTPDVLEENFQWWPANPGVIVFTTRPAPGDGPGYTGAGMLNADGSDYRLFDAIDGLNTPPALSPDGQWLALDGGPEPTLYRLDTGQIEALDLTAYGLEFTRAVYPSWSPDGQKLAWKVYGPDSLPGSDGKSAVVVLNLGEQQATVLHPYSILAGSEVNGALVWSPDGLWLAVLNQAEVEGQKLSLWVLKADGSEEHDLGRSGWVSSPVWSPDGRKLAYNQWPAQSSFAEAGSVVVVEVGQWQPQKLDLPAGAQVEAWLTP